MPRSSRTGTPASVNVSHTTKPTSADSTCAEDYPGSVESGSDECECPDGFDWSSDGTSCVSVPVDTSTSTCVEDYPGSIDAGNDECDCPDNFAWNADDTACIAEAAETPGSANQNTDTGADCNGANETTSADGKTCECVSGYDYGEDGTTCVVDNSPGKNCKITDIDVQCENGSTDTITLASTATTDKPSTYGLKAIGTFDCTDDKGAVTQKEEDVTASSTWKAADETIAKADNGDVQAVSSGDTSIEVTYKDAAENVENDSVDVYVESCPLDNSAQAFLPKPSENILTSYFKKFLASTADAWSCSVCGGKKESTCKFIAGNEEANFAIILQRSDCNNLPDPNFCQGDKAPWDKNSNEEKSIFDATVSTMSSGLHYVPDGDEEFAIYESDTISDQDNPDCPRPKFVSLGYICNGSPTSGVVAFANKRQPGVTKSNAAFCAGGDTSTLMGLLAHEVVGHAFAGLDDEYLLEGDDTVYAQGGMHYNCTADSTCSKWKNIDTECVQGCDTSGKFYSSIAEGIMEGPENLANGFGKVDEAIIEETYKNFPGGAASFAEPNMGN